MCPADRPDARKLTPPRAGRGRGCARAARTPAPKYRSTTCSRFKKLENRVGKCRQDARSGAPARTSARRDAVRDARPGLCVPTARLRERNPGPATLARATSTPVPGRRESRCAHGRRTPRTPDRAEEPPKSSASSAARPRARRRRLDGGDARARRTILYGLCGVWGVRCVQNAGVCVPPVPRAGTFLGGSRVPNNKSGNSASYGPLV